MGAIWGYDVYLQQSNAHFWVEVSAENNSSFEAQDSDVEISEEDQNFQESRFLSVTKTHTSDNHSYRSPRLILPFYSVWHPPKLS